MQKSHAWLLNVFAAYGPFDGIMMFSQACGLVASFLLKKAIERETLFSLKILIFISGVLPTEIITVLDASVKQESLVPTLTDLKEQASVAGPPSQFGPPGDISRFFPGFEPLKIPTVHVYGLADPYMAWSKSLTTIFDTSLREEFVHAFSHIIPREKSTNRDLAMAIDKMLNMTRSCPGMH